VQILYVARDQSVRQLATNDAHFISLELVGRFDRIVQFTAYNSELFSLLGLGTKYSPLSVNDVRL
jgi:hypothetical protein